MPSDKHSRAALNASLWSNSGGLITRSVTAARPESADSHPEHAQRLRIRRVRARRSRNMIEIGDAHVTGRESLVDATAALMNQASQCDLVVMRHDVRNFHTRSSRNWRYPCSSRLVDLHNRSNQATNSQTLLIATDYGATEIRTLPSIVRYRHNSTALTAEAERCHRLVARAPDRANLRRRHRQDRRAATESMA